MSETPYLQLGDPTYDFALASDSKTCFVARMSGLYAFDEDGTNWRMAFDSLDLADPLPALAVALAPDYDREATVFAGVSGGILRSGDGGEQWERVYFPALPPTVTVLAVSPYYADDGCLFAGTLDDGMLCSRDRGQTWQSANFGLLDPTIFSLALSPGFAEDGIVYAGAQCGLFRSLNAGRSWLEVEMPTDYDAVLSMALSPAFTTDHTMFAGTESSGLWRSRDAGKSWQRLCEAVLDESVDQVVLAPNYPEDPRIVILCGGRLYLSPNDGASAQPWRDSSLSDRTVTAICAPKGFDEDAPVLVGFEQGGHAVVAK
jgi:photosystem II stability/assembly factor-like uncharacterized protein